MSDPVAEKSGFLRKYMSGHPDTLVAYAKWFGKVEDPITSAEMTAIDTKVGLYTYRIAHTTDKADRQSMTLLCTLKNGTKKEVYVPIDPPLKGYDDVKPRLLDMKATAQEKLGMIKAPHIASFHPPPASALVGPAILVGSIIYLFLAPIDGRSPVYEPARLVHSVVGTKAVNVGMYILAAAHVLEAGYTSTLCRKHTGFFTGAAYVLGTVVFGFPIWQDLRARIQNARIDSVMKVQ
ncbi:hypothetical protein H0H93_009146 [Arthromyces matolae]|nr:hypothetical protein H0H93_009146 [Arthromyces matolae]